MDGLLLVDKPKGWTSHDVVAKVRNILRLAIKEQHESRGFCMEMQRKDTASSGVNRTQQYDTRAAQPADTAMYSKNSVADSLASRQTVRCKCRVKVGHTGTLDPLATGLLVLCVGSYCKRAQEFSKLDKVYEVTMKLGQTSTTGDSEGELTKVSEKMPKKTEIQKALVKFTGKLQQTPPAYSAIKVNGKRAYQLAREGKPVKLKPRTVTIHSNFLKKLSMTDKQVEFTSQVSSGTYIRSLVDDIGEELVCGAYMSDLKRTQVGEFKLHDAQTTNNLDLSKMIQF